MLDVLKSILIEVLENAWVMLLVVEILKEVMMNTVTISPFILMLKKKSFYAKLMCAILTIEISWAFGYRHLWLECDFTYVAQTQIQTLT